MGLRNSLANVLSKLGLRPISRPHPQKGGDRYDAGRRISVEQMTAARLANLICLDFQMPVTGGSQRALWLDSVSDQFIRGRLVQAVTMGLLTGDCIVVPRWTGRHVQDIVIGADKFAVVEEDSDELTHVAYVCGTKRERGGDEWELVCDLSWDGEASLYRYFVTRNGEPVDDWRHFEEWRGQDWGITQTGGLMVARFKSWLLDPSDPNAVAGVPLGFFASQPIDEMHYLLNQEHAEFELSEKAVTVDKTALKDMDGKPGTGVGTPHGLGRLFLGTRSTSLDSPMFQEWAPTIQNQPYAEAIEQQKRLIENAVGVDSGVISHADDMNYQNVDNVRKSTLNTQGFVKAARGRAEVMLGRLVECWDVLGNYYGIVPQGDWDVQYKWSDDYIDTFSDRANAILAGQSIGATDAYDYRLFVMGEAPDEARARVDEIARSRPGMTLEPLGEANAE